MKYFIVNDSDHTCLMNTVNEKIKEGWEPYGNLNVISWSPQNCGDYIEFYQAMVKHTKKVGNIPNI